VYLASPSRRDNVSKLWVKEGPLEQSADERIAYKITTTNWISSPTTTTVKVYDETQGDEDVTADVGAVTGSESGDVITLSVLKDLTVGHSYRVEVKFIVGASYYECKFRVRCVF